MLAGDRPAEREGRVDDGVERRERAIARGRVRRLEDEGRMKTTTSSTERARTRAVATPARTSSA